MKDQLNGSIKLVFQPNEENAGALPMINEGVLENPTVDAVFGVHIWTPLLRDHRLVSWRRYVRTGYF